MTTQAYDAIDIARQLKYVREASTPNTGQRVEGIQRWGGGQPGDSWCAYFATLVLDICYQGDAPIERTGSCDDILQAAIHGNWIQPTPRPGDLYLRVHPGTQDAHHVGFVVAVQPRDETFTQISGNTSSDGKSSNGDGVYETTIALSDDLVFVRIT